MTTEKFNELLASSCQNCQSGCCKKGFIFLPKSEFEKIRQHTEKHSPEVQSEFLLRSKDHGDFVLYDQRDRCQFLDESNLCQLHGLGIKPSECFWWPYHVYTSESHSGLDIRISTTCCDGFKAHSSFSPYPEMIEQRVNGLGFDMIRRFRAQYSGSYGTSTVRALDEIEWIYMQLSDLPAYRNVGEKLFPEADWDDRMRRYSTLLRYFQYGLLAVRIRQEILAYLSLWPVTESFHNGFLQGATNDENLIEAALADQPNAANRWFLTAIAILTRDPLLRSHIRWRFLQVLSNTSCADENSSVVAEAITPAGESFLKRAGFQFCQGKLPKRCILGHN